MGCFFWGVYGCIPISRVSKNNSWFLYKENNCPTVAPIIYLPGHGDARKHIRGRKIYSPLEYGTIYFLNNDSINGLIGRILNQVYIFGPFYDVYHRQKTSNIIYFRLYNDSTIKDRCYADYYNLYKQYQLKNYWRLLGEKNEIKIFDNFKFKGSNDNYPIKGYFSKVILISKSKYQKLYKWNPFSSLKESLRRFINKNYHEQLRKNFLKTIREEIDYILEKENEKQNSKT